MRRSIALLLALLSCVALLAGCAKDDTPAVDPNAGSNNQGTADNNQGTENKPAEDKYFKYYYVRSGEETTLNPHDSNANVNINVNDRVAGMIYGYIPREDGQGPQLVGIYADGEPVVDETGTVWTIKLKKDMKWQNGDPINADTWIYSWKMILDPNLYYSSGSALASNYITIKGAKDYYNSVAKKNGATWEDVGIKKVNDYEITIETEGKYTATEVMRHFYLRSGACVYEPIYSKSISADGTNCTYGTTFDQIAFAGQYYITNWNKGAEITFKKNPNWPLAELTHIDEILSRVVGDESTRVEMFEKGEADHIDLGTNGMAKYGEDPRVRTYGLKTINTIEVNQNHSDPVKAALLGDADFRKALFYAIDRNAIAKLTQGLGTPYFLSDQGEIMSGVLYRNTAEAKALVEKNAPNGGYDAAKAAQLMDQVLSKNNQTKVTLTFLYTEGNENRRAVSEYLAAQFKTIFGGKVELDLKATPSSSLNTTMRESTKQPVSTWDIAWSGWGLAAESFYPWKKFEKYTSTNSTRFTAYSNDEVDRLYQECLKDENRLNDQNILNLTVQMEQAMYDDMTCVPVFAGVSNVLYQEHIDLPCDVYSAQIGYGWYFASQK